MSGLATLAWNLAVASKRKGGKIMAGTLPEKAKVHAELATLHAFRQTVQNLSDEYLARVRDAQNAHERTLNVARGYVAEELSVALDNVDSQLRTLDPEDTESEDDE